MKFFFCFKIAQLERSQSVNADTFYNQIYVCIYIYVKLRITANIYCYFYSCCWCHCIVCRFFYFLLERRFIWHLTLIQVNKKLKYIYIYKHHKWVTAMTNVNFNKLTSRLESSTVYYTYRLNVVFVLCAYFCSDLDEN